MESHVADVATASDWSVEEASYLYQMSAWSDGYFSILPNGHAAVEAQDDTVAAIDIRAVVDDLRAQGITAPLLLRFPDILYGRVKQLNEAFLATIDELAYPSSYTTVYPIKVNQLHQVVEEVLEAGKSYNLGLECGSKAELVAALGHLESDSRLLICNGYKDATMLRLILEAQALDKQVIPVVEELGEFEELLRLGKELDVPVRLGARVNLTTAGVGKWAASCGDASKFGIEISELLYMLDHLEPEGKAGRFELLHFHLGSQISDIHALKRAVREISRVYVQLRQRGVEVRYLDVGGGLGVNYEGNFPGAEQAINYTIQEYANAIVGVVQEVCDQAGVAPPWLLSESGRALTAHHAVLVVEALSAQQHSGVDASWTLSADDHRVVEDLESTLRWVEDLATTDRNGVPPLMQLVEAFHDAHEKREEANQLFSMGYLPLEQRALATQLYWTILRTIDGLVRSVDPTELPSDLAELDDKLKERYLCGFSVFQSILDHWAIDQLFPVVPLQRLDEQPTRRAELVDLTCDSDGKISTYVAPEGRQAHLDVHELTPDDHYYFGIFLTGAYQDIMGDVHNLFGRLPEVHVYADDEEPEGYYVEKIIPGNTVEEMLASVQYFTRDLQRRMKAIIREKVDEGKLRPKDGVELLDRYRRAFEKSTYVNRTDP